MYYQCCVCKRSRQDAILHHFPVNEMRLKKWLKCLNRDDLITLTRKQLSKLFVCQNHFEKKFISSDSRIVSKALPSLLTEDEISSGIPSRCEISENSDPQNEHNYTRKRHFDHTYCKREPLTELFNSDSTAIQTLFSTLSNLPINTISTSEDQPASESKPAEAPLNSNVLLVDNTITTNIAVEKPVTDHEAVPMDNTIKTNIEVKKPVTDHEVAQSENATIKSDICTYVTTAEVVSECEGFDDCYEAITETNKSYDSLDEFLIIPRIKHSLSTAVQTRKKENIDPVPAVLSNITCDNCKKTVVGFHYRCLHCVEYTHCHICEMKEAHPNHYMIRIPKSPVPKVPAKTIDNICENFKVAYICSREENQRRETISCDNQPDNNSKACDSDLDLSEDVKSLIRKEVTRALKNKFVHKTNQLKTYLKVKRKQHSPHETLKKRNITVITNTITDEAPPVIEIGQNDTVPDLVPINNKTEVNNDENKHNESVSTIATVVMDVTSPGVAHMMVTDIVTQLILEITQDGRKIIYKYVDT